MRVDPNRYCSFIRPVLVGVALLGLFSLTMPTAAADKPEKKPSASKRAKPGKPRSGKPKPDGEDESPSAIPADVTPSKATLRWKFKQGDERRYLITKEQSMSMKGRGRMIESQTAQIMVISWKVLEVHEDGGCRIIQKFDSVRATAAGQGGADEYDSAKGIKFTGPAKSLNPLFDLVLAGEYKHSMSAQGKISDVEIPKGLADAFQATPGRLLTEEGIKEVATLGSTILPVDELASGDDWSETKAEQAPQVGVMKTVTQYTYQGVVERDGRPLDVISINALSQLEGNGQIKFEITSQKSEGAQFFDNEIGYLLESRFEQKVAMKLNLMGIAFFASMDKTLTRRALAPGEEPPSDVADESSEGKLKDADVDQPSKQDDTEGRR